MRVLDVREKFIPMYRLDPKINRERFSGTLKEPIGVAVFFDDLYSLDGVTLTDNQEVWGQQASGKFEKHPHRAHGTQVTYSYPVVKDDVVIRPGAYSVVTATVPVIEPWKDVRLKGDHVVVKPKVRNGNTKDNAGMNLDKFLRNYPQFAFCIPLLAAKKQEEDDKREERNAQRAAKKLKQAA
jgi:hypothetical protein